MTTEELGIVRRSRRLAQQQQHTATPLQTRYQRPASPERKAPPPSSRSVKRKGGSSGALPLLHIVFRNPAPTLPDLVKHGKPPRSEADWTEAWTKYEAEVGEDGTDTHARGEPEAETKAQASSSTSTAEPTGVSAGATSACTNTNHASAPVDEAASRKRSREEANDERQARRPALRHPSPKRGEEVSACEPRSRVKELLRKALLVEALGDETTDAAYKQHRQESLARALAGELEGRLFDFCCDGKADSRGYDEHLRDYRLKARSLAFNLKQNDGLRGRLLSGHASPEHIVSLKSWDLAREELQDERNRELQTYFREEVVLPEVTFPRKRNADENMASDVMGSGQTSTATPPLSAKGESLSGGDEVCLVGLVKAPAFNGRRGHLQGIDPITGRCVVRLVADVTRGAGVEVRRVKAENVILAT